MLDSVQDYIDAKLTHSVHTSGAKSYRACRRRWSWLMRDYYYPKVTAKPLEFGVAFHIGMEVLYDPKLWDKPVQVVLALAQQAFLRECDKQFKKYADNFEIDAEVEADYQERRVLGKGMLKLHAGTIRREDINKGYRPLAVEVKFEVPLEENGEVIRCNCADCFRRFCAWLKENDPDFLPFAEDYRGKWVGLPVTYGGRIDAVMQDDDDKVWIVDWKSAARMVEDRKQFLLLDDQITRYLKAMQLCHYEVAGFIYHEVKKQTPEEPEPMKVRRKGCAYSVSKQQAVQYSTYLRVIKDNDNEAYMNGCYDEYLEWLKENEGRFSARYEIPRNQDELDSAWEHVIMEAKEMINPALPIYPNAGRFSCENCAFIVPCLAANDGSDPLFALETMFDKKEVHYWEDAKPSTDSPFGVQLA